MEKKNIKAYDKKRIKIIVSIIVAALIVLGIVAGVLIYYTQVAPCLTVSLVGGDEQLEVFSEFKDMGAQGVYGGGLSKSVPVSVTTKGEPDMSRLGKYVIEYICTYKDETVTVQRVVEVVDTTPPVITAPEEVTVYHGQGLSFEYGAEDNYDGEMDKALITLTENEDSVTLSVSDSSGNTATKTVKKVVIIDNVAPVITLNGGDHISVRRDLAYEDPGFTATDDVSGDLTSSVVVEGEVDTSRIGSYVLTYSVKDGAGNETKVERTVVIYPHLTTSTAPASNGKTVYLTFDDGPCSLTPLILDILAEYEVKATFFVTAQFDDWLGQIGRAYREGHAIGVHTLTHNFAIYSSTADYFNDLSAMEEVVKEQIGSYTDLIRFPGGSSNTVSRGYCQGIMTTLAAMVEEQGYTYFDWNVGSGDTSTDDPEVIYQNVVNGIAGQYASVVLMHDIKYATYQILPRILDYCLENGYSFGVLTSAGPVIHHGINN